MAQHKNDPAVRAKQTKINEQCKAKHRNTTMLLTILGLVQQMCAPPSQEILGPRG